MMDDFGINLFINMLGLGADIDAFGFSESDIDIMFGDAELVEKLQDTSEATEVKRL